MKQNCYDKNKELNIKEKKRKKKFMYLIVSKLYETKVRIWAICGIEHLHRNYTAGILKLK